MQRSSLDETEILILKELLDGAWHPTILPTLANTASSAAPVALDALKRLHSKGHLAIRKWDGGTYKNYSRETSDEFFHRAGFELKITPEGRHYFETHVTQVGQATNPEPLKVEFWSSLHPRIRAVAEGKFKSPHFADAVLAAFKEINNRVKIEVKNQAGKELDGVQLMNFAFSPNSPLLLLGDVTNLTGKDIQTGYMFLFAGVMSCIRNPLAHEHVELTPQQAVHLLFIASWLMQKLDEAKRGSPAQAQKTSQPENSGNPRKTGAIPHGHTAPNIVFLPPEHRQYWDPNAGISLLIVLPFRNEVLTEKATAKAVGARISYSDVGDHEIARVDYGVWYDKSERAIDISLRDTAYLILLGRRGGVFPSFFAVKNPREEAGPFQEKYDTEELKTGALKVKITLLGEELRKEFQLDLRILDNVVQISNDGLLRTFQLKKTDVGEDFDVF